MRAKQGWDGLAGRIERREERERVSVARLRGIKGQGTPSPVENASPEHTGTPQGGAPTEVADVTVEPVSGKEARRGHGVVVGENCHGTQLEGGLAILSDCVGRSACCRSRRPRPSNCALRPNRRRSKLRMERLAVDKGGNLRWTSTWERLQKGKETDRKSVV